MNSFPLFDSPLLAFWSPGPAEMLVLGVVALLLYGGNLPEVARSWGKTFAEFRRGLTGLQNEFNDVIYSEPEKLEYRDDAHYPNGYEEPDVYNDDEENSETKAEQETEQDNADQSDSEKSADPALAEEKPTD